MEGLSEESRKVLENEVRFHTVTGKKKLIMKGDTVGGVYIVEEGGLRVYTISPKGRESTLYWIEPGESCILAMNCVFSDILYPAWVENDRSLSRIAIIPALTYRKLHEKEKSIQRFTVDVLSSRIFDLMSALEEVFTLPVNQRLANLLLKKSNSLLHLVMSHEEIASHLGTAREVVTRHLKNFEKMGFVKIERGYTKILSVEELRSYLHNN
jgi:CRP/FNR family transcriptional regulator